MNPIKSNFTMQEGKLLGHIISKDGITIDPDRGKAILKYTYQEIKKKSSLVKFLYNFLDDILKKFSTRRSLKEQHAQKNNNIRT